MSSAAEHPRRRRVSIRWRLALASALVTSGVLLAVAAGVGIFLTDRVRTDFSSETADAARRLADSVSVTATPGGYVLQGVQVNDFAASQRAKIRIVDLSGGLIAASLGAPEFGILPPGEAERDGYLVETRYARALPAGRVLVQYARPTEDAEHKIGRIWFGMAIGVVLGAVIALAAALAIARRTLRPLNDLTAAAKEVRRTADPGVSIPVPPANDEVRDLAVTLSEALAELDEAKAKTEGTLNRQREFIADASHELRTPLTALIANLELLAADATGDAREDSEAALRSGRRMKQLVADLLLLARSDGETESRSRVELDSVIREAVDEVRPLLGERTISVETVPVAIWGEESALHQAVRNLLANAISHTPDDTEIAVALSLDAEAASIRVEDSGPGIALNERDRVFERFYRSGGDSGNGTGLGLAIVAAVSHDHGGSVDVFESRLGGAGFEIRLPAPQASIATATTSGRRPS